MLTSASLIEKIKNGVALTKIEKELVVANITAIDENKQTIKKLVYNVNINEIVFSNNDVIIYTVKPNEKDDWSIKYPYRFIYNRQFTNGLHWVNGSIVSPTFDTAFINYLAYKYDGENSQFASFAQKMLGIVIE